MIFTTDTRTSQISIPAVYQVTGVEGVLGERLFLVRPLPLEQKPAVEWLAGLEKAVKFSLASRLTDCLAKLPHPLAGQPLTTQEGVLEWLQSNVLQNVLLALDIHWSRRLLQTGSDNTHSNLQTVWLAHTTLSRSDTCIQCYVFFQCTAPEDLGEHCSAAVKTAACKRGER